MHRAAESARVLPHRCHDPVGTVTPRLSDRPGFLADTGPRHIRTAVQLRLLRIQRKPVWGCYPTGALPARCRRSRQGGESAAIEQGGEFPRTGPGPRRSRRQTFGPAAPSATAERTRTSRWAPEILPGERDMNAGCRVQFPTECPTDFPMERKCQLGVPKEGFWVSLATGRAIPARRTSWREW